MAVILSAGASRKVPCVAGTVLGRRGRVKGRACSMLDMIPRPAMLARLAARQLRSHPWQLGLAILGIALGVAVAVSIDLANGSALRRSEERRVGKEGRPSWTGGDERTES